MEIPRQHTPRRGDQIIVFEKQQKAETDGGTERQNEPGLFVVGPKLFYQKAAAIVHTDA
jgi:hypothetical protein